MLSYSTSADQKSATMYTFSTAKLCVASRFGWVALSRAEVDRSKNPAIRNNHWDEARLFHEVSRALDLYNTKSAEHRY